MIPTSIIFFRTITLPKRPKSERYRQKQIHKTIISRLISNPTIVFLQILFAAFNRAKKRQSLVFCIKWNLFSAFYQTDSQMPSHETRHSKTSKMSKRTRIHIFNNLHAVGNIECIKLCDLNIVLSNTNMEADWCQILFLFDE